jgi:hypothetical protein
MDSKLAAIYGTGNYAEEETDLEKQAAAELLIKLAEEEGVNLDQFDDSEIAGMINSIYKGAEEEHEKKESKEEEEAEEKKKEEKGEEKVAEADFLGRVMAHAMVNELNSIEKEAGEGGRDPHPLQLAAMSRAMSSGDYKNQMEPKRSLRHKTSLLADKGKKQVVLAAQKALTYAKGHKGLVGGVAGGAAALGAGGLLAHHLMKKKEGSAMEVMAQEVAYDLAKEAGYIEKEKQASVLDQAIYTRALQICEEAGLPVEWNQ